MRFFGRNNAEEPLLDLVAGPPASITDEENVVSEKTAIGGEKNANVVRTDSDDVAPSDIEKPSEDVEEGVKKVEAAVMAWTKKDLIIAYACIFLVYFIISLQEQIGYNVSFYVTSSFSLLPLTGTTTILSNIIGGVTRLPIAKFINIVGRPEGFLLMTFFATMGLVTMAACTNVQSYAAGQVFLWLGYNGMMYVLQVVMADTSSLKNRAYVFAFSNTPYIVTTFAGPRAAASFIRTSGWPWAYGVFTVVIPLISVPISVVLFLNQRKAFKMGLLTKKEQSGRSFFQSVSYYFWEFDVPALFLITAAFALILLPFSLASYQEKKWGAPMIIAMWVIGGSCLVLFPIYEKYLSRKTFIPFPLLTDRTVMGACLLSMFLFISFYCWDSTFYSYLQAVHGLSITNTGYVANIYSIGSCFWGVVVGYVIRKSGYFKWVAAVSIVVQIIGVGLMIEFRQAHWGIGYVILCQIMIAFGGGGLVICEEMAVMAAAKHNEMAGMLALIGLFTSVGGGIGQAISAAIYTNTFPGALEAAMPRPVNATLNAALYGSLVTQLSYPVGSPERTAVITAYAVSQNLLTITGTVFLVPCFLFIFIWRNYGVKGKQEEGNRL